MGDPKFPSKTYNTPSHPWQKIRIEQESNLVNQYGLKNKKEIWINKVVINKSSNYLYII